MTFEQAFDMIKHGETLEQYENRQRKIIRLVNERDFLEDALEVLTEPEDQDKAVKKRKRLDKVINMINELV